MGVTNDSSPSVTTSRVMVRGCLTVPIRSNAGRPPEVTAEPFSDFSGPRTKHVASALPVACYVSGCEKRLVWSLSRVQAQLLNPEEFPEWQE